MWVLRWQDRDRWQDFQIEKVCFATQVVLVFAVLISSKNWNFLMVFESSDSFIVDFKSYTTHSSNSLNYSLNWSNSFIVKMKESQKHLGISSQDFINQNSYS